MGKAEEQRLHEMQQRWAEGGGGGSGIFFCHRCSIALVRIGRHFSIKCFAVLILSLAVFLSAVFWIIPRHSKQYGFDVKESIKLSATVQSYFRLQMPVKDLVPNIERLEYDIYGEIGVPLTKVAILSMHKASESNLTNVVFGVLADPIDASINPVSLSVLRSSVIELFLGQVNLTLNKTLFGEASSFEILKFPGGLTIIPEQSASFWQIPQILFNFTLNNSINDINQNFVEFSRQLRLGLRLRPYENVYVRVTNYNGSTRDPPVTVEASVVSDTGSLLPQRLRQLVHMITRSPPNKNLGLDDSVFGKVKAISLSSYLNDSINPEPPTPCPAPAPSPGYNYLGPTVSPDPILSPSPSPCGSSGSQSGTALPPDTSHHRAPSPPNGPHYSLSPVSSSPAPPTPCKDNGQSHQPSPAPRASKAPPWRSPSTSVPPPDTSPMAQGYPVLSPLPSVSYQSSPKQNKTADITSPLQSSSSATLSPIFFFLSTDIRCCSLFGLLALHVLLHAF